MAESRENMREISVRDIKIEKQPFAHGGFGEVYNAKWRKGNVVIKVIKAGNEEEKHDIKSEAKITLGLKHRNVIKLFGITCMISTAWQ